MDDDVAVEDHRRGLCGWRGEAGRTANDALGPMSLMRLSVTEPLALPWPSVSVLPRSPTWRFWANQGAVSLAVWVDCRAEDGH